MSVSPVLPGPVNLHRALFLESKEGEHERQFRVVCKCGHGRKHAWWPSEDMAWGAQDAHALGKGRAR